MKIQSYLHFNGNCQQAFAFYEQALGGKVEFAMTYDDSPMKDQMPEGMAGKIMHTSLRVGDQAIMGCDAPHNMFSRPQGFRVSVSVEQPADAERIFRALSEGGTVVMPIQETFWAQRFGMIDDQFGIPWMVNCEKPMM